MTTTTKRPVHLDLTKIRLPIGGVMSIMHRATGVFLFLATPYLIYLLQLSLSGPEGFTAAGEALHGLVGTVFVFLLTWSVSHHLLAGIRYLLIDVDVGVDRAMARRTAFGVVAAGPVLAVLLTGGVL
jgi:succinate dehydrogenase / fumarate reductase cytochrome b subunit